MPPKPDDRTQDDLDRGTPGASARARYARLRRRDDRRRREVFGRLAPLVALLTGPRRSTEAWAWGAEGEERVGALLDRAVGDRGLLLHDRRIPGSRANIDHVAIVPSGVWVIDAKHYHGRLERRSGRGWFMPRQALYVGRRDRSALIASAERQRAEVARRLPPNVAVRAALCFTGIETNLFARPFTLDGILVTWPKALSTVLCARGRLDADHRHDLATALGRAFPPYAPSGTSHKPTGAAPSA
ncbi:MAG TPA: nuclease-related domain-containing protein [Acidimicrobiales bacterium]|nr:nuclease-related domain-containing protein [Acidimicrobiales bacterium]